MQRASTQLNSAPHLLPLLVLLLSLSSSSRPPHAGPPPHRQYDIDHPEALGVVTDVLSGLAEALGCRPNVIGWELANEPSFRFTTSAHTRSAFETWLGERYGHEPSALVSRWKARANTGFRAAARSAMPTGQTQLISDNDAKRQRIPDLGSGDSSRLADWGAFNSGRVLRWARAMREALQGAPAELGVRAAAGACHRTFMRLNNDLLLNARIADHGMDRSALTTLFDVSAFDSNFGWAAERGESSSFHTPGATYDTRRYSVDWLNYFASVTLLRGLAPSKPLFDAEFHVASATRWRRRIVDDDGGRSVSLKVVLAAAFGQGAHMAWLWARDLNGDLFDARCNRHFDDYCAHRGRWFAASMQTQPRVLDAYVRASLLTQLYARTFARIAQAPPRVLLLHSQQCATLGTHQTKVTLALLEPLTFLGVSVGFVDADADDVGEVLAAALETMGTVLLIPGTTHASLAALRAVRAAHAAHGGFVHAVGLRASEAKAGQEGQPGHSQSPSPDRGLRPGSVLGYGPSGMRWDDASRGAIRLLPGIEVGANQTPAAMVRMLEEMLLPDRDWGAAGGSGALGAGAENDGPYWLGGPARRVRVVDEVVRPGSAPRGRPNTALGIFARAVPADAADEGGAGAGAADGGDPRLGRPGEVVLFLANLRPKACAVTLLLARPGGEPTLPAASMFSVWDHEPIAHDVIRGGRIELRSGEAKLLVLSSDAWSPLPPMPPQPLPTPPQPPPTPPQPPSPSSPPSPPLPSPPPPSPSSTPLPPGEPRK